MSPPLVGPAPEAGTRVLVTGGTGFIGSALVRRLAGAGCRVGVLTSSCEELPPSLSGCAEGVELLHGNLLDEGSWEEAVEGFAPELAFHLAWYVAPREYLESPKNLDHLQAGIRLVGWLFEHGVKRVVGVGTCYEYDLDAGFLSARRTPLKPSHLYSACKHALSTVGAQLARQAEAEFVWARIYLQYGPYEYPSRLVPFLAGELAAGESVELRSHGLQVRDFLHVDDVGSGLAAAGAAFEGAAIDICSGRPVRVRDLAEELQRELGTGAVRFAPEDTPLNEPMFVCGDVQPLWDLGWRPARGVASYVAARGWERGRS